MEEQRLWAWMRQWALLSKTTGRCWDYGTSSIFDILNETLRPTDLSMCGKFAANVASCSCSSINDSLFLLHLVCCLQFEGLLCVLCVLCCIRALSLSCCWWVLGPGAFLCVHLPSLTDFFFPLFLSSRWIGIFCAYITKYLAVDDFCFHLPIISNLLFQATLVCVCVFSFNCERKSDKQHVLFVPVIFLTEKSSKTESCENFNT